jgi:hypothetical protein
MHEDGIIDEREKAEYDTLIAEQEKLNQKAKEGKDILRSYGLDTDFSQVVDGLTQALDQAHKDWEAEVERAKAAFAKAVIPIKVSLDPGGAREAFQKQIGAAQLPGETAAGFSGRLDEAAHKLLVDDNEAQGKRNALREAGVKPLQKVSDVLRGIEQQNVKAIADVQKNFALSKGLHGVWSSRREFTEQGLKSDRESTKSALALQTSYAGILDTLRQEKTVKEGAVQVLREQTEEARKNGDITQTQFSLYEQVLKQFEELVKRNQQLNDIQKQRSPEAELEAARTLLEQQKAVEASTMNEAEIRKEMAATAQAFQALLEGMKQTTEGTANAAEKTATGISDASTQAVNFTNSTTTATSALGVAVTQATALANEMERAASAAAAVEVAGPSGGASQYQGGPFYASGGQFRGQDRHLTPLARGEMVVNQKRSRQFFSELNAMNQGSQPVYREQGGTVTNVGDVNVTVQGGDSSQQTVREIGHALRREIKRGNLKLR